MRGRNPILAVLTQVAVVSLGFSVECSAQQQPSNNATLTFEIASVKLRGPDQRGGSLPFSISGSRLTVSGMTLTFLICLAYDIQRYQLIGGPGWIDTEYYDIAAKAEGQDTLTMERARPMLQALLSDRFHVKIQRETRDLPVYALVIGKNGSKLKEGTADSTPMIRGGGSGELVELTVINSPLATFAAAISGMAGRPVVNRTGMTGGYDFKVAWTREISVPTDGASDPGPSLFTAIAELGLKLETTRAPFEVVVIESIERPSEN